MLNVTVLIGRLTKDPELRYTGSGKSVTQFTLAVDDPFSKGDKKADFINIVTWDKAAEACSKYLSKGKMCAVEGRLSTRNYDNASGQKVYVTEVIANNVRFLEKSSDGKPLDISDEYDL